MVAVVAMAMIAVVAPGTAVGAAPPPSSPAFQAEAEAEVGATVVPSITIVQDSIADSPQDFSFTGCSTTLCAPFALDDDDDPTRPNSGIAEGLAPGTYTVTQSPTDRWTLTDLTCTTGETVDLANRTVTIDLAAGEAVVCTFTNRSPSITIRLVSPVNTGQDFNFTGCLGAGCSPFHLDRDDDADLPPTISGAGLAPGTYTVTQDPVTNWFTTLTCDGGATVSNSLRRATITLGATTHTTCTFENLTRSIGIRQSIGGSSITEPQAFTYQGCFESTGCGPFTLGVNGAAPDRIAASGIDPGRYTITQAPVEGYTRPEISCSFTAGVTVDQANRRLTLDVWEQPPASPYFLGANFRCTFTNRPLGPPLDDVVDLTAGSSTCARLSSGEARCWGSLPTSPVSGLGAVADISPGRRHTCAVLVDGRARCWGENSSGELGTGIGGTFGDGIVSNPAGDGALTGITQIDVGDRHTCAVVLDQQAYCWGANGDGRLGDGTTSARSRPVPVVAPEGPGPLTAVASITAAESHTCALLTTGQARCWGSGANRALGDGASTTRTRPVAVRDETDTAPLSSVTEISAGVRMTCAVMADTTARCWGNGALGGGTGSLAPLPVVVANDDDTGPMLGVVGISAGDDHRCLVLLSGHARCWGTNQGGRVGDGTAVTRLRPTPVVAPTGSGQLADVASIAAGASQTCAALTDGQVRCWGATGLGQGDLVGSAIPVTVLTPY